MSAHQQLVDLVRFLTTPETDIWVNVELMSKEVPGSVLGQKATLGQLSALKSHNYDVENNVVAHFNVQ
jgi:hypothetical protein